MKPLLIKLLLFAFPMVLLSLPVDLFLSKQLRKSKYYAKDEFSVWNDLYDGNINADIAVYGSSRAWVIIDPHIIEKNTGLSAYNLGIDGHNFRLQYLRHRLLIKNNKTPKFIIYSVDMATLEKRKELYNPDQFLPYMLLNKELKNYIDDYEGYSFYDYYLPLVRYYGKTWSIKYALLNSIRPVNPDTGRTLGYEGMISVWNNDLEAATKSTKYFKIVPDSSSILLFNQFLKECDEQNIQVILVYTPEFIDGQNFVRNRAEIISLYKEIASTYNIPFLDYSDNEISRNKANFYNASHLRISGAELFTSKLISDLKKMHIFDAVSNESKNTLGAPIK